MPLTNLIDTYRNSHSPTAVIQSRYNLLVYFFLSRDAIALTLYATAPCARLSHLSRNSKQLILAWEIPTAVTTVFRV